MSKKKDGLTINKLGDRHWYKNNQLHRVGGPAIEFANGKKYWYQDGLLHRENGPAMEFWHGVNKWYINGKELNQDEINAIKEKLQFEQEIILSNSTNKKLKI